MAWVVGSSVRWEGTAVAASPNDVARQARPERYDYATRQAKTQADWERAQALVPVDGAQLLTRARTESAAAKSAPAAPASDLSALHGLDLLAAVRGL